MKSSPANRSRAEKRKATQFVHRVLGDPERAAEVEGEPLESYAKRGGFEISNPIGGPMAGRRKSVAELEAEVESLHEQIQDLEEENETLRSQLDDIAEIVAPPEEEEDEGEDEED